MAALIVEAVGTGGDPASQGVARPGNRDPLLVVASVAQSSGMPATGLTSQDLQIEAIIVAAGGALVKISTMSEQQPGIYLLGVVPAPTSVTWMLGRYLFWLAAKSGTDQGQTVFDVFVD
jgi:hypothetical protein